MPAVSAADAKIISQAKARMNLAISATSSSREDELDDLKFMAASPDNPEWQWPQDVLSSRGASGQTINARPTLVINKLPQHVKQVTNDQRQNRPSGKVIPVDDKADVEVAEMLNGVIRHIEYISDADVAYDTACESQVTFGEGYFRILTDYVDENSFDQDIKIGRIRNSFSVYMDPTIQDPAGADAKWAFIYTDMLKEDFEAEWPDATPISSWPQGGVGDQGMSAWLMEKTIRVAEYFYFENQSATLCLYQDASGEQFSAIKGSPQEFILEARVQQGLAKLLKERKTTIRKVKWCKLNGFEILEKREWAGKWIPIVRVIGNEFEIDGEIRISGLIRNAKDPQRLFNYWRSAEAEHGALATKAPWIGAAGQFEGYEKQWETANINNWPYLEYNAIVGEDGKQLPPPFRTPPPMAAPAFFMGAQNASDDIKGTTGQYDPSLGAESNEKSGRAIIARERQSDTGTYHYADNLAKAIRFAVRQILDLIPKVYDTQRVARIVGLDGEVDHVKIDPTQQQPIVKKKDENGAVVEKIFNPCIGKYDVMATTGPNYMTKRQEAMNAMAQLLQGNPQLWQVAGDLFIKNMDWPGAQEMAARFAKTIPAELRDEGDETPEMVQAKQAINQLQGQLQTVTTMLENVQNSIEAREVDIQEYKADTERMKAMQPAMTADQITMLVTRTLGDLLHTGGAQVRSPVESQAVQ